MCEYCVDLGFLLMGHAAGLPKGWSLIEKCDECGIYESDWDAAATSFVDCRQDQDAEGVRVSARVRSAAVPLEILKARYDETFGMLVTNWYGAGGGVYKTVAEARKAHGSNWILIPPRLEDVVKHCQNENVMYYVECDPEYGPKI
jgi:hypothetical protein